MNLYAVKSQKRQKIDSILAKIEREKGAAFYVWNNSPLKNKMDFDYYLISRRPYLDSLYLEVDKIAKIV